MFYAGRHYHHHFLGRFGRWEEIRDDDTGILLQSSQVYCVLLRVIRLCEGKSNILHCPSRFCFDGLHVNSRVSWRTVLHRESCLVTCPYQASFRLTVVSRGSCDPTSVSVFCSV
ncbi:hypothetical protein DPMN_186360 [Dreissena polymorpha]|uniref:Uncharacterized protein n=1 Tax=Dreissena polymorpha TaxID=45954 RepID=A0A9D4DQA5_DREPO|nr:hypothetical protein DPMN_186360 [Dreissena polymorpha]